MSSDDAFEDVLSGNERFAAGFTDAHLDAVAARGIALVTCMDSRISPLEMLGLQPGDAKILRNAGARVTDDVLRTLVLATHLLGVERIMIVAHTKCKMASASEEEIVAAIREGSGIDAKSLHFGVHTDPWATVVRDVERVRHWPFLPDGVVTGGFIYDVTTGRLTTVC